MDKGKITYIPFKKPVAEENDALMCLVPKAFLSWVEHSLIFSTLLEVDHHSLNTKERKLRGECKKLREKINIFQSGSLPPFYGHIFTPVLWEYLYAYSFISLLTILHRGNSTFMWMDKRM